MKIGRLNAKRYSPTAKRQAMLESDARISVIDATCMDPREMAAPMEATVEWRALAVGNADGGAEIPIAAEEGDGSFNKNSTRLVAGVGLPVVGRDGYALIFRRGGMQEWKWRKWSVNIAADRVTRDNPRYAFVGRIQFPARRLE